MTDGWLLVLYLLYQPVQKPAPQSAFNRVFAHGYHAEEGRGEDKQCHYYSKSMDWPQSDVPLEQALSELENHGGYIRFG